MAVFKLMLRNPIILTIAFIEFCSGFLRQAIMQWFRTFAKQTDGALGLEGTFVYANWGMLLCCAGILGGVIAGIISDRIFDSRRGPVAAILYGAMLLGAVVLIFAYASPIVGWLVKAHGKSTYTTDFYKFISETHEKFIEGMDAKHRERLPELMLGQHTRTFLWF